MNEKTDIRAVELVRRIRDEQAERLQGLSDEEVIEYFRRAGELAREDATRRYGKQTPAA
jgi:hypothetical protein